MSLINDALKRASQSDKKRSAQAPVPIPMQPASVSPRSENSSWLLIGVTVVAALGLVVSSWLYLTSRAPQPPPMALTVPAPTVAKAIAQPPAPAPKPTPVVQKPSPSPVQIVAAAPIPALAPPETFPTNLTVKAIFYNKTNPHALVNGQTVETGDKIGDVLVTGILTDRIFLDWKGQSKVLMMGGQ